MYLKPRVIPVLLIEDDCLVKTVRFNKRIYIGDPINAVRIFNEEEADELCILDISSHKNKRINYNLLKDIATEAFMPLSYGGWVRSMEDVKELFRAGFEKVIFNSALLETPDLIRDAVAFAGAQSIVASIDFKKNFLGKTECFAECGKRNTKRTITEYVKYVEELGAGEIFLNSIDRDGMMNGYDYSVIKEVSAITKVPVICCGGAGNLSDMAKAVKESGAHAVAAGSLFVFFGPRKAVLINYPKEDEQRAAGLFE